MGALKLHGSLIGKPRMGGWASREAAPPPRLATWQACCLCLLGRRLARRSDGCQPPVLAAALLHLLALGHLH